MPEASYNCKGQRQDQKVGHDRNRELVHHLFNITLFKIANLRVHHDACFFASLGYKTDDPVCVHQLRSLEQTLLVGEVEGLPSDCHFPLESIQIAVWPFNRALSRAQELVWAENLAA